MLFHDEHHIICSADKSFGQDKVSGWRGCGGDRGVEPLASFRTAGCFLPSTRSQRPGSTPMRRMTRSAFCRPSLSSVPSRLASTEWGHVRADLRQPDSPKAHALQPTHHPRAVDQATPEPGPHHQRLRRGREQVRTPFGPFGPFGPSPAAETTANAMADCECHGDCKCRVPDPLIARMIGDSMPPWMPRGYCAGLHCNNPQQTRSQQTKATMVCVCVGGGWGGQRT